MILTAWSEGVGSNWVGFQELTEVKSLLASPMAWMSWPFFHSATRRRPAPGQKEAQVARRGRPPRAVSGNPLNDPVN